MVKSEVENVMEANTSGLVMVDFFLRDSEEFAW
jgi:hypothetical protein